MKLYAIFNCLEVGFTMRIQILFLLFNVLLLHGGVYLSTPFFFNA